MLVETDGSANFANNAKDIMRRLAIETQTTVRSVFHDGEAIVAIEAVM